MIWVRCQWFDTGENLNIEFKTKLRKIVMLAYSKIKLKILNNRKKM